VSMKRRPVEQLFFWFYQFGMNTFFPVGLLILLPMVAFEKKWRSSTLPRLGFQGFPIKRPISGNSGVPDGDKVLWIHALSVGEILSAAPLIKALHVRIKPSSLYLSVSTKSGYEIACARLKDSYDGLFFFPFDLLFSVRRALAKVAPSMFVLVETDIWPGFMAELGRRGIPCFVINGRLSASSLKRYRQAKALFSPALNTFDRIFPQSRLDAASFRQLGVAAEKVADPGNLKFDAALASTTPEELEEVRAKLAFGAGAKILVAGSTHDGEEAVLRTVFLQLRETIPELKLILVPRHPHRAEEVHHLFLSDGLRLAYYSMLTQKVSDVIIVDELGILNALYSLADLAYVGGSLVRKGGQNPIEPAAAGKPLVFGPDMSDFPDIANLLMTEGGAIQVRSAEELTEQCRRLLCDNVFSASLGEKNRALVEQNRGITDRLAEEILEAFEKTGKTT
jgi:3-deoxy-D-manno-octulosonic-acid transferase